ncbi:Phospholipase D alpha [Corchorus olitorius]|uniref:Phospholipase D alpha n=1 Tax=Corchorus olitorius TaxID=93759 RepID=A0A1R3G407_9ROSI|nr:Phospholipase D alpha [Corchorus olitorius]
MLLFLQFLEANGPSEFAKIFVAQFKRVMLCQSEIIGLKVYATVDLDKARMARTRMVAKQGSSGP